MAAAQSGTGRGHGREPGMQIETAFAKILSKSRRPLLILAQQDDPLACSGILQGSETGFGPSA